MHRGVSTPLRSVDTCAAFRRALHLLSTALAALPWHILAFLASWALREYRLFMLGRRDPAQGSTPTVGAVRMVCSAIGRVTFPHQHTANPYVFTPGTENLQVRARALRALISAAVITRA